MLNIQEYLTFNSRLLSHKWLRVQPFCTVWRYFCTIVIQIHTDFIILDPYKAEILDPQNANAVGLKMCVHVVPDNADWIFYIFFFVFFFCIIFLIV